MIYHYVNITRCPNNDAYTKHCPNTDILQYSSHYLNTEQSPNIDIYEYLSLYTITT